MVEIGNSNELSLMLNLNPSRTLILNVAAFHHETVGSLDLRYDPTALNQFACRVDSLTHRITFRRNWRVHTENNVCHNRISIPSSCDAPAKTATRPTFLK